MVARNSFELKSLVHPNYQETYFSLISTGGVYPCGTVRMILYEQVFISVSEMLASTQKTVFMSGLLFVLTAVENNF